MERITCPCEFQFEVDLPDAVDITAEPDVERQILDGSFLSATCPRCGKLVKPELPVLIRGSSPDLNLFFVPELERDSFLLGRVDCKGADRVAIGYQELVEKIKLRKAGLDDQVVELMKFDLMERQKAGPETTILFWDMVNDRLEFHIHGLRKDEVGIARASYGAYQKEYKELEQKSRSDPYAIIIEPPYVSVAKIELEIE